MERRRDREEVGYSTLRKLSGPVAAQSSGPCAGLDYASAALRSIFSPFSPKNHRPRSVASQRRPIRCQLLHGMRSTIRCGLQRRPPRAAR